MPKREKTHYVKEIVKDAAGKDVIKKIKVTGMVPFKCPRCYHKKAWPPRGLIATIYFRKCTRCGYQQGEK